MYAVFHEALQYQSREIDDYFLQNSLQYMRTNCYFNVNSFDKVISEIKWHSFLPHNVLLTAQYMCSIIYTTQRLRHLHFQMASSV